MNREILFRGMISMGDMMEGSLLINGDKTTIMDRGLVFGYGVDPKTVGQYTGLKDKNGAKIFEGDILNWDYCGTTEYSDWMKNPAYFVQYEEGYRLCGAGIKNSKMYLHAYRFKYCEVIGNIHQNPDLL